MKKFSVFIYRFFLAVFSPLMLAGASWSSQSTFTRMIEGVACVGIVCFALSFKWKKALIVHLVLFIILIAYAIWLSR